MKRAMSICVLILVGGCAYDQAYRYYANETYPPVDSEDVEVLRDNPARPFDVIADLQARRASVNYIRRQAAKIGADAVIIGIYGGYRAKSDAWASEDKYANTYTRIAGTAIRYKR